MHVTRFGLIGNDAAFADRRRAIAANPHCDLIAACPASTTDLTGFLARQELDAVVISGDRCDLPELICAALSHGLHVLSDLVPASTIEQLIKIRQAEAAAPGRVLALRSMHRLNGSIKEALRLARTQTFGPLLSVRATYGGACPTDEATARRQGGGALIGQGSIMLDLMHAFAGPFVDVSSLICGHENAHRGTDDNAMALLRTHDGVSAFLHASATQWRQTFRLELGYRDGYIWLDGLNDPAFDTGPEMMITAQLERDGAGRPLANPDERVREFPAHDTAAEELGLFLAQVKGEQAHGCVTSQDAFDTLNTIQRIYAADPAYQPIADEAGPVPA